MNLPVTAAVKEIFSIGDGDLHISRRINLAVWLQILQEWSGIAAITVYAPTIFAQAGYDARKTQWISGVNNVSISLQGA